MNGHNLKVLILSQYFWPEEFRVNDIVKGLVERGVSIDVLTGKPNYPVGLIFKNYTASGISVESYDGMVINRIPIFPRGKGGRLKLTINYLSFILSAFIFSPFVLRRKKFDLIFVYAPSPLLQALPALFLRMLKKAPLVLWVQDLWPESLEATGYIKNRYFLSLIELCSRLIYAYSDLILVQSEAFIPPVRRLAAKAKIKYYPNSVDAVFRSAVPDKVVAHEIFSTIKFPILFAGNIGSAQAMEVIISAAEILEAQPDIGFVIAGQGSRFEWMSSEVKRKGLKNISLIGRFPIDAMPGMMEMAAALLVTLADQPIYAMTIPAKIQSYLAMGKPIIACLNGEGARVVKAANAGFTVPAEDADGLAQAILKLYRMSADERSLMGKNGHSYYEQNFDHDKLVDELIQNFKEAISDSRLNQESDRKCKAGG